MSAEEGGGPAGGGVQEETSSPSTCEEAGTTAGALRPGEDLEPDPGEEDGGAGVESCRSNGSGEGCSPPTPSCRICFQGAEQGEMFNPCRCDGTVRYTHHHCLLKWISERGCWTCELCCYRFHVVPVNMKRPWQWQSITVTLVEKVQMVAVFLGSLFLVASISWLLWSALSPNAVWQRRDLLFQICYGMYGVMDLVCVGQSSSTPSFCPFPRHRSELFMLVCFPPPELLMFSRSDRPRGGSSVQRFPPLAGSQPALGRAELRQDSRPEGDSGSSDSMVTPHGRGTRRPTRLHPAGRAGLDLSVFDSFLFGPWEPEPPESGG
ncbi:E3 ubiquitin-protein ligase MARCHF11 isoform 1-T1 [Synchiropus picturatus]